MEYNEENKELEQETESTKSYSSRKIALSFVVTFLIIALIIVFVIMNVIPMISSKEKFFKISQNAGSAVSDVIEQIGDSVLGRILSIDSDEKIEIATDLDLALETNDETLLNLIYGFKNLKLSLKQNVDFGEYYVDSNAKISLNDDDFVAFDVLEDEEHIALKADGIADKYLRAEKNNLHPIWHRLNLDGPDQFSSESDFVERLQLTKSEQKKLVSTLKRVFLSVKKLYSNLDFNEGSEIVNYNGADNELAYVDLQLTSKKINDSVIAVLEQLKKESESVEIIASKLNVLEEFYSLLGYENSAWTAEEILLDIEDMLDEIRDFEVSDSDGMILRVYYSNWDLKPIGFAMFDLPTDEVYDFNYADGYNKLILDSESGYFEYSDLISEYVDIVSKVDDVDTHNLTIRYKNYMTGEFLDEYTENYTITLDYSTKNKLSVNIKDSAGYLNHTLSGEINGKVQTVDFIMNEDYGEGETNSMTLKVVLKRDSKFDKEVLSADEFIDLNNATDEEFNITVADIQAKWNAFTTSNETKINQFSTIVGAYLTLLMPSYDMAQG